MACTAANPSDPSSACRRRLSAGACRTSPAGYTEMVSSLLGAPLASAADATTSTRRLHGPRSRASASTPLWRRGPQLASRAVSASGATSEPRLSATAVQPWPPLAPSSPQRRCAGAAQDAGLLVQGLHGDDQCSPGAGGPHQAADDQVSLPSSSSRCAAELALCEQPSRAPPPSPQGVAPQADTRRRRELGVRPRRPRLVEGTGGVGAHPSCAAPQGPSLPRLGS